MNRHSRVAAIVLSLLLAGVCRARSQESQESGGAPGVRCVDVVLRKARCSNPDEICRLLGARDPQAGSNLDAVFDFRIQDLGDGTEAFVFSHKPGADAYSYLPNFHFVRLGEKLELLFDGRGLPTAYLTDRPRVNKRYQLERVSRADIPGMYKKREAERWFWTGEEYALAFTRLTVEGAKDAKQNGTTTDWKPEAQEVYKKASASWSYKVASGDTLGRIAGKYGVSTDEIMRQNDIRNAGSLRLGQTIRYDGWKVTAR